MLLLKSKDCIEEPFLFINGFWNEFADLLMSNLEVVLEILFHAYVENVCCHFNAVHHGEFLVYSESGLLWNTLYITYACFFGNSAFVINMKSICSAVLLSFESIKQHL